MSKKYLYLFTEGDATMRELLGGKGANLAEMTKVGLPVPQGFTISTEACTQYYEDGRQINDEIQAQIMEYITKMEEINGKKFGDLKNPQYAIFSCPCGCGQKIELNANPESRPCWKIQWHLAGTLSFSPSINRKVGCGSHFYLKNSKVLWCH